MKKPSNQVRSTVVAFTMLVVCAIFFGSCHEEEARPSDRVQAERENRSEISLIEEELGVKFFKQDLTITDESGENQVAIRIASLDKSMLEEYLKSRTFSIVPIYERGEEEKEIITTAPQKDQSTIDYNNYGYNNYELTLIVEVIDEELKEGVVGVGFRNEPNPLYKFDASGRTQYNYQTQHVSSNWPSTLGFKAFTYEPEGVTFMIGYKDRWYSSWYPVFGPATWCCNEFNEFDVDGPYRARVDVAYNNTSDYYLQFFY